MREHLFCIIISHSVMLREIIIESKHKKDNNMPQGKKNNTIVAVLSHGYNASILCRLSFVEPFSIQQPL